MPQLIHDIPDNVVQLQILSFRGSGWQNALNNPRYDSNLVLDLVEGNTTSKDLTKRIDTRWHQKRDNSLLHTSQRPWSKHRFERLGTANCHLGVHPSFQVLSSAHYIRQAPATAFLPQWPWFSKRTSQSPRHRLTQPMWWGHCSNSNINSEQDIFRRWPTALRLPWMTDFECR